MKHILTIISSPNLNNPPDVSYFCLPLYNTKSLSAHFQQLPRISSRFRLSIKRDGSHGILCSRRPVTFRSDRKRRGGRAWKLRNRRDAAETHISAVERVVFSPFVRVSASLLRLSSRAEVPLSREKPRFCCTIEVGFLRGVTGKNLFVNATRCRRSGDSVTSSIGNSRPEKWQEDPEEHEENLR